LMYKDMKFGMEVADKLFEHAVSSQHLHHSIALYITAVEMMVHAKSYAEQIVKNSHVLSKALIEEGFNLEGRNGTFSDSHLIAITGDFPNGNESACRRLHDCNISTNSRKIFGKSILRIGVQELTRRGMKEKDMKVVAEFFKDIILNEKPVNLMADKVKDFNSQFKGVEYTLDDVFMK